MCKFVKLFLVHKHFYNNDFKTEHSFILHHNSTIDSQLFNTLEQENYSVTDELIHYSLCIKYPHFSLTQTWSRVGLKVES